MPEDKGTGKHPHKSTEEPWPHHKDASGKEEQPKKSAQSRDDRQQGGRKEQSSDLKEREYRDEHGNVHHHTRTSQEMKDRKAS